MNETVIRKARKFRKGNVPMSWAWRWAKEAPVAPRYSLDFKEQRGGTLVACLDVGKFQVQVKIKDDPYPDISYLGELYDRRRDGAIRYDDGAGRYDMRDMRWFVPGYSYRERYEENRKAGMARGPAHEAALAAVRGDMDRYRDAGVTWGLYDLLVSVHCQGVELADSSLGGIGIDHASHVSDECRAYLESEAAPRIDEALEEAEKVIARLCAARAPAPAATSPAEPYVSRASRKEP